MQRCQPADDLAAYRRSLGQFATGVTVVTAKTPDGRLVAMTANSFSSVSLEPPLVSWSVKRASQSYEAFVASPCFAINILASDQIELSRHFGKSGDDKFDGIDWTPGIDGVPLLTGAAASFECRRAGDHDGGDHLIMLGAVEQFTLAEREVLLFVQGKYGVARDHPAMSQKIALGSGDTAQPGPINELMPGLLYRAYGALSSVITEVQHGEGFTPAEGRMLGAIATYRGRTLEALLPDLYLGTTVAGTALAHLQSQALINVASDGALSLTMEGQARLKRLVDATLDEEADKFEGLSDADIETTRRVLRHVIRRAAKAG